MVSREATSSAQCLCPATAGLGAKNVSWKKPKRRSRQHQRVLARRKVLSQLPPLGPSAAPRPRPSGEPQCQGRLRPGASAEYVASPSKYVAIDCEMVGTGPEGRVSELARCSVVSYYCDVLYDKYVLPEQPITDFRSRWSGITPRHMAKAIPFQVAQKEILKLLKGKVVVGHAVHNDFQVLKYTHPRSHIRDTTCVPKLLNPGGPPKYRVSLKDLALHLLHKKIQVGHHGHSSVEDAATAMELYRLVEHRWEEKMCRLCTQKEDQEDDSSSDMQQFMDDRYWPDDLDPSPGTGGGGTPSSPGD